ncbi:MAG: hypothetical protein Q4C66_05775 [Lachnospiraceae bacterium]|nr:hypothetical protein [Lachnospiraceae bacterium]
MTAAAVRAGDQIEDKGYRMDPGRQAACILRAGTCSVIEQEG